MNCFRPVWGLVWADHPDGQQLPSWEGDPQHAGWASGPALRRPGRRIQPRCLAPARLAALAQLQVGLHGGAQDTGWSWELNFIWLERLVFQSHLIQLVPQMMMYYPSRSIQLKNNKTNAICSVRKRDRAHREIKNIFFKVIQKRRQSGEKVDDILQTLIDATYKWDSASTDIIQEMTAWFQFEARAAGSDFCLVMFKWIISYSISRHVVVSLQSLLIISLDAGWFYSCFRVCN